MVEVFPTQADVMAAAADRFVNAASRAITARGRFAVALSGGSTPEALYRLLAADPHRGRVDWARAQVFWGDERCVPPDDPGSNYRMAREALLDRVPIPTAGIHRIRGEDAPEAAAQAYESILREQLGPRDGPPLPTAGLDLVLLGLGPDGHTASLFPGSESLQERLRWALAVEGPTPPRRRVTLTPPVFQAAGDLLFLVTGSEKNSALRRALHDSTGGLSLPTRVIRLPNTAVHWLADSGAAAGLPVGGAESA